MGWTRTDDLGGAGGAFPTTFGLDGLAYVLDLNEDNAEQLRSLLAPFVGAAKTYGDLPPSPATTDDVANPAPARVAQRQRAVQAKVSAAAPPDRAARRRASRSVASVAERDRVRQWAQTQGLQVADRGRISAEIMAAYSRANEGVS